VNAMTKTRNNVSKAKAQALREGRNKLYVPSAIGLHYGQGRHVVMPATWDEAGTVPPGWSGLLGEVETGEGDLWSIIFPDDFAGRVEANAGTVLDPPEKAFMLLEYGLATDSPPTLRARKNELPAK